MALSDILGNLISFGSKTFDPTKNAIIIANYELEGVLSFSVEESDQFSSQQGISESDLIVVKNNLPPRVLSITVLSTSPSYTFLKKYLHYSRKNYGFALLTIVKNGLIEVNAPCWPISAPSLSSDTDTDIDPTFKIGFYEFNNEQAGIQSNSDILASF